MYEFIGQLIKCLDIQEPERLIIRRTIVEQNEENAMGEHQRYNVL